MNSENTLGNGKKVIADSFNEQSQNKESSRQLAEAGEVILHTMEIFSGQEKIKKQVDECIRCAKEAQKSAEDASQLKPNWVFNGKQVEALQLAISSAGKYHIQVSELMQLMFEQQQKLGKCIKQLFALCAMNMTITRFAVKDIKMRLEGATTEEISEEAQRELESVVLQLMQQLDLMEQQKKLRNQVESLESKVDENSNFLTTLSNEAEQVIWRKK